MPPPQFGGDTVISGSENVANFGTLPQYAPGISYPGTACAPTSAINSLTFLANTHPGLFVNLAPAQLDTAVQVNTMQGWMIEADEGTTGNPDCGISLQGMLGGKLTYLDETAHAMPITANMVNWEAGGARTRGQRSGPGAVVGIGPRRRVGNHPA